MSALSSALLTLSLVASSAADANSHGVLRRFGLFVGSNDGGSRRATLRYATTDAESMSRVLEQFGGVTRDDLLVLKGPSRQQLGQELERLRTRVDEARANGARTELILYYSGHADETGLLLGRDRLSYDELRQSVDRVPAGVRVVILDSCHAGSFVRLKGGRRIAPFLVDSSHAVQGHAFLSSSSADEAAQESDRIRSSYFTFALLAGLRGAADTSRDGRVTLTEAYQFAFQETLAHTERTLAGPQHPAYDIHLAGTGDLVMTDLRGQTAGLVIPEELAGHLLVRDSTGRLMVELEHRSGRAMELGFEPGRYRVRLESSKGQYETEVTLAEGKRVEIRRADLVPAPAGERVAIRGGEEDSESEPQRKVPINVSFWPPVSVAGQSEQPVVTNLAFNLPYGRVAELQGVEFGLVNTETRRMLGVQFGAANVVHGEALGVQFGAVNYVEARLLGIQYSAVNITRGDTGGIQQGAVNYSGGVLRGIQEGAINVSQDVFGLQSGAVNVAREVHGVQVGAVNVASGESIVQLGGVNVTNGRSRFQLGLVNFADDADAPVGLFNWVKNGYRAVGVWTSDTSLINVGLKLGGRYTYGLLAVGTQPFFSRPRHFFTAGIGGHVPIGGAWFLDIDATASMMFKGEDQQHNLIPTALRLVAIREIAGGVALTAGVTWNVMIGWDGVDADLAMLPQFVQRENRATIRQFPGFVLGVQL